MVPYKSLSIIIAPSLIIEIIKINNMYNQILAVAIAALIHIQGAESQICTAKCLSPLAVAPVAFQMPVSIGMACGEPISDCGPQPMPLPIIQAPPVTVPTIEGPIIPLPSPPIPCPKTIAHKCVCTKTVVKPQLIQRCITVPSVQRYLKRTYTPVIENIAYKARPKCSPCACKCRAPPPPPPPACVPPPVPACAPPPVPLALPYSRIC